ncbi:tail completion protein gp17 [Glaciimonas sp. GNP009]
MTVESTIFHTLRALVSDRVWQNVADEKVALPYMTYQLVGGAAVNFLDPTIPSKKNSRWQIDIWSTSPAEVALLSQQAEDLLRVAPELRTTVLGAAVGSYEPDVDPPLHGRRQDFSFWY